MSDELNTHAGLVHVKALNNFIASSMEFFGLEDASMNRGVVGSGSVGMGPYGRYHDDWLSSAFFLQVAKNDLAKVPDQK